MCNKQNKFKTFVLALCLFLLAGLSNAFAFSVDISNLYYTDASRMVNNFNFTNTYGAAWQSGMIVIPTGTHFSSSDGSTAGLFGLFPGSTGLTLNWTSPNPATLATPSGDTDGAAIITTNLPGTTSYTVWTYSVKLENFADVDSQKINSVEMGMGSDTAVGQPMIEVSWTPMGSLMLQARIGDSDSPLWQSMPPVELNSLTPATTTLELKVVNTGSAINFYYTLNSGTETLIGTFGAGNGYNAELLRGFPVVFPFVSLYQEDVFAEDPFSVNSVHTNYINGDQYGASGYVRDPGQATYESVSVTITGAGCNHLPGQPINLTYANDQWSPSSIMISLDSPPECYPTFTFTGVRKDEAPDDVQIRTVNGYVEDFATNLLPTGNTSTPITFSWTGIAGATGYGVQLHNPDGQRIWGIYDLEPAQTSVPYVGGPSLTPGLTYKYYVNSMIETEGSWNHSQAEGTFTYVATDVTVNGNVRDWNGAVISGTPVTVGVYLSGSPTPLVTRTANPSTGDFSLPGVPTDTSFRLKFTATGYITLFSAWSSRDVAGEFWYTCAQYGCSPMQLPTAADLNATGTGVTPDADKAIIFGRIADNTYRYSSYIAGAVVTATSDGGTTNHPVTYLSPFNVLGGTSTYQNGRFYVLNVAADELVTVTASKTGWDFSGPGGNRSFTTEMYTGQNGRVRGVSSSGYTNSIGGTVRDITGASINSVVTVALQGDSGKTINTSPVDGTFMLGGLPRDATFHLLLTEDGYATSHVGPITLQGSLSNIDFIMWTTGQFSSLSPSGGMIAGSVRDNGFNPLSGATITLTSKTGTDYSSQICYTDGSGGCSSSTLASGKFYISNVTPGDVVRVEVTRSGYTFEPAYMNCFASTDVTQRIFVGTEAIDPPLYAGFTGSGLWTHDGTTWTRINKVVPESMITSGSNLYVNFTGSGLYKYDGTTWTRLHTTVPESMVASDSTLYVNFTGSGLWAHNGTTWTRINKTIPESMITSGSNLYVTFTGSGLYRYDGATWTRLHATVPESMVASDSTLYANFTGSGLWAHNGTAWTRINKVVPENMIASSSALYATFTGSGLYKYDGTTWTRLHTTVPASMIASYSTLYVNFTGSGLWAHDGTSWTRINKVVPESMIASDSSLYVNFTSSGLYKYDGSTWTRLHTTIPESMVVD